MSNYRTDLRKKAVARLRAWILDYMLMLMDEHETSPYEFVSPSVLQMGYKSGKTNTNLVSAMVDLGYLKKAKSHGKKYKYWFSFDDKDPNFMKYLNNIIDHTNKIKSDAKARLNEENKPVDLPPINTSTSDENFEKKMVDFKEGVKEQVLTPLPTKVEQEPIETEKVPEKLSDDVKQVIDEVFSHVVKKIKLEVELEISVNVKMK